MAIQVVYWKEKIIILLNFEPVNTSIYKISTISLKFLSLVSNILKDNNNYCSHGDTKK